MKEQFGLNINICYFKSMNDEWRNNIDRYIIEYNDNNNNDNNDNIINDNNNKYIEKKK